MPNNTALAATRSARGSATPALLPWLLFLAAASAAGTAWWQLDRARNDHRDALEAAQVETETLRQRMSSVNGLQTQLDEMRTALDAQRDNTAALHEQLGSLTEMPGQLETARAQIASLEAERAENLSSRDRAVSTATEMRPRLLTAQDAQLSAELARKQSDKRAATAEAQHRALVESTGSLIAENKHLHEEADSLARALDAALSERDAALQQRGELQQRLSQLSTDIEETRRAQQASSVQLTDTRAQLQQASTTAGELDAQLVELGIQRETDTARFDALRDRLEKQLGERGVTIETLRNRLTVITLQNDVLFSSGSAELTRKARRALDEIAGALREYPQRLIAVEGHTDSVPLRTDRAYPTNWELSAARAASAVRFLAGHDGVAPDRLQVIGHGKFRPVSSNKTADGRKRNRRIEIRLLPEDLLSGEEAQAEQSTQAKAD